MNKIVKDAQKSYKRYGKMKGTLLKWWRVLVDGWQKNTSPIYKVFFCFSAVWYFIGLFTFFYTPLEYLGVFGVKNECKNCFVKENISPLSKDSEEIEFINSKLENYSNPDKNQSTILNDLLNEEERNLIKVSKIIFDDPIHAIKLSDKAVKASSFSLLSPNKRLPIYNPSYVWQLPESDHFLNFDSIDYSSIDLGKIDLERNSLFRTYPNFPIEFNDSATLLDSLIEDEIGRDIEYKVHGRLEMDVIANNNLEKKILNFDIILTVFKNTDDAVEVQYRLEDVKLDSIVLYCEGNGKVINSIVENCI